jgi:hypothetical protein
MPKCPICGSEDAEEDGEYVFCRNRWHGPSNRKTWLGPSPKPLPAAGLDAWLE